MNKIKKYEEGGGIDPVTGKPIPTSEIAKKYKNNPYVISGDRYKWADDLDKPIPASSTKGDVKSAFINAGKFTNIDPSLLFASSKEEGYRPGSGLGYSPAYDNAAKGYYEYTEAGKARRNQNKLNTKDFPVDGFHDFGLDTFSDHADNLIKKGYLPANFKERYSPYYAWNDKMKKDASGKRVAAPERVNTAAFRSSEDAILAKAAMLRDTQDQLDTYATKQKLTLTPEQRDFFTLVGYNSGLGNMQKALNSYNQKGYLKDNKFLDINFKPASYNDVYTYAQRRLQNRKVLKDEGYFDDGGKLTPKKYATGGEVDGEDPIDPITGKPTGPTLNNAKNVGIDVWGNAMNTPVPINPNAPKDQQIFKIDQTEGTPVEPPEKIIPLAQIAEQVAGKFGQQNINQTNQYVSETGQIQTEQERKDLYSSVTQNNLDAADRFEKRKDNAEMIAGAGITAINAFFNKKEAAKQERTNRRKAIMQETFAPVINPYLEGTGSQAIMKKGGKMRKWEDGAQAQQTPSFNILDGGKAEQVSGPEQPMVEFKGKTHAEGGIGIEFGGKVAEIEHGEVGYVDNEGSLNIFGKMKVPGTNKSFKKAAKDMAAAQLKVDKKRGYYSQILNNSDNTDDYQDSAISTAKVMLKSLDNQAQQIKQDKEALASYQNLVLALAGKDENMMKYGGRMQMAEGGGIDPNDPKSVQAIIDKYSGGKAPLKAEDFIEVSKKYGVPLDLMLAQAIQESSIGTKGMATRSHNIFNVKNNGNTGRLTDQGSWKQGLENYAKLIRDEYTTDGKTVDVGTLLSTDFKRPKKGGFYAEEKGAYTGRLRTLIQEINPNASYQYSSASNNAAGDPGDEFKQFKGKDGKQYNSPAGLKPSVFYKDPAIAKALEADQTFPKAGADANWGPEHDKLWNSLPQEKRDELLNKSKTPAPTDKPVSNTPPDNSALEYKPKYEQIVKIDGTKDTPYGPAQKDPTQFRDKVNIGTGDRKRGWLSPLAIEQIAPELLTVATNKRQAVPQLSYQPELKQTFDISYQLGRNENQSSFNQVAKIAENTGNVDALSALAANLYKANEQYNMQEVQGNAQQKLGVYGQNVDNLNDAKLKNLQLIESQQNKQAAADYNTWKTDIAAFTSMAGKELQNKLENKTYNAYANLFKHYGFDKKGNVTFNPDDVVTRFTPGEAQQFGMLYAQKGLADIMQAGNKTATTYDKDGNIKKVSSIDDDINEFNSIWKIDNLDESLKRKALKGNKYAERIFGQ